jgi:hypothetical protein
VQLPAPQVLISPGQVFRCEVQGKISYSDKPCPDGRNRELKLPAQK